MFKYIIPVFLVAFGILAFADNAESLSSDVADGALSVLSADDCTVYAEQANNFFLPSNNCYASGIRTQQSVAKRVNSFSKNGGGYICLPKHICVCAAGSSNYKFSFALSMLSSKTSIYAPIIYILFSSIIAFS